PQAFPCCIINPTDPSQPAAGARRYSLPTGTNTHASPILPVAQVYRTGTRRGKSCFPLPICHFCLSCLRFIFRIKGTASPKFPFHKGMQLASPSQHLCFPFLQAVESSTS